MDDQVDWRPTMAEPRQARSIARKVALVAIICTSAAPTSRAIAQEDDPLVVAAGDGNLAGVQALLDRGADPNQADESQTTPLMAASWGGHAEVARLLLDVGARPNEGDASRATPLMAASLGGHLPVVQLLLAHDADVRIRDVDGDDALSFAVFGGSTEVAEFLLEQGVDPNGRNALGQTPFLVAAQRDEVDLVRVLLERGADIAARDDDGDGALSYAAFGGSTEVATFLMDRGADPNRRNRNGVTPHLQAAASDNVAVLRALLDGGADVSLVDAEGATALHQAARTGAVDALMLLIDRGADVNAEAKGWTGWMIAAAKFDTATADALAARGAAHGETLRRALERTTEAGGWAHGMRIDVALAALAAARRHVPDLPIRGEILNVICWNGTLLGHADRVAELCDEAVTVLPEPSVRDSRGLNRAVRGELSGVHADFQSFVAEAGVQGTELRQRWIAELEQGTNPITPATLEALRYPWLEGSAIAAARHLGFDLIGMVPGLAEVPDSALISREGPYQTDAFQRVFSAGGTTFGWGDAQLSGVVFNATLMGGTGLAESGVEDIQGLSEEGFRETFLPSLAQSMGFEPDSAEVEELGLDEVAPPRTGWRIGVRLPMVSEAGEAGETRAVDVHLVFFARHRVIGTCVVIGAHPVTVGDVVRIVSVFENRVADALPKS
jgi:ankyrin repeat protein